MSEATTTVTPPADKQTAAAITDATLQNALYGDGGEKPKGDSAPEPKKADEVVPPAEAKTEDPPASDKIPEPKKAEEPPKAEDKPPEKYELKLPKDSQLTQSHVDEIAAFAKEKSLSNAMAQTLLERENATVSRYMEQQKTNLEEKKSEWYESAKSDKEIGGEGFAENAELAKRVLNKYASPQLKEELNKTGLGNYPELMRVFVRIGKASAEDKFVQPGSQAGAHKSIEDIFYPSSSKKE